jgi:transposase
MSYDLTLALQLPDIAVERCSELPDALCLHLRLFARGIHCNFCQQWTEDFHQDRPVLLRDLPAFGRRVYLQVPRRQFFCQACKRYPTERLAFVQPSRRHTQRYESFIYERVKSTSIEQVSREEGLGRDEVEGIFYYVGKQQKKTFGKV